jgi:hypothetical protein
MHCGPIFLKVAILLTPYKSGAYLVTQHAVSLCRLLLFYFYQKYIFPSLLFFFLDCPLLLLNQTISLMKFESQWRKEQSTDERNYPSVCSKDLCYIMDVSCWKWIIVSMVITVASSLPPGQWECQKVHTGLNMLSFFTNCNQKQSTRNASHSAWKQADV